MDYREILVLIAVAIVAALVIFASKIFKHGGRIGSVAMENSDQRLHRVVITDIDIPFWDIVGLMVKWAVAAIPALLILAVLFAILAGIFAGMIGS